MVLIFPPTVVYIYQVKINFCKKRGYIQYVLSPLHSPFIYHTTTLSGNVRIVRALITRPERSLHCRTQWYNTTAVFMCVGTFSQRRIYLMAASLLEQEPQLALGLSHPLRQAVGALAHEERDAVSALAARVGQRSRLPRVRTYDVRRTHARKRAGRRRWAFSCLFYIPPRVGRKKTKTQGREK